jgi:hypothetical protein
MASNPSAAKLWLHELDHVQPKIDELREKLRQFSQRPRYFGDDPELDPLLALANKIVSVFGEDDGFGEDDDDG